MKKVQLFYQPGCPYCRAALKWIDETRKEKPETADLPIEMIDEIEQPALADTYDYYYVPTFYVDEKKVHEGACTKEKVQAIMIDASAQ